MTYRIASVATIFQRWARFLLLTIERANGETLTREVEDHGDAAAVLAFDPTRRKALLVEQFRPPRMLAGESGMSLEIIAGRLEGEAPEEAARREAMEEAGVRLERLEKVVESWSLPGISTERLTLFLAEYAQADRVGLGGGLADEGEDITVHEYDIADLAALADRGELSDMKTHLAVLALRFKRPELF
jgi:nudix-type nucleoside diphosphatase (YffH/AdpP family)